MNTNAPQSSRPSLRAAAYGEAFAAICVAAKKQAGYAGMMERLQQVRDWQQTRTAKLAVVETISMLREARETGADLMPVLAEIRSRSQA